jgi:FkbM family methyltransferase
MRSIPSLFQPLPEIKDSAPPETWPIRLTTPDAQWAFAAKFKRVSTDRPHIGPVLVRIVVQVDSGSIGLGCLNANGTDYLDEQRIHVVGTPVNVDLILRDPTSTKVLAIRNVSPSGRSEASLLEMRCFALDVQPDTDRSPGLSDPRPMPEWNRYYGTYGESVVEKLRVQSFLALRTPTVLRWTDGLSVHVLPNDQLSRALFVSGTYEPNTLCALRKLLRPEDVFIDVGANVGIMSLVAARWVGPRGRVFSFEPSEREHRSLVQNLELNEANNVTPIRAALSDRVGLATLRVAASSHGGLNTLGESFAYDGVNTAALEQIDVTTLDEFTRAKRLDRVSVVKLDVEGAEGAVLAGSTRLLKEFRPALVLEIFPRALGANKWTVADVENLLRAAGYNVFSIHPQNATIEPMARISGEAEQNIVAMPGERSPGS